MPQMIFWGPLQELDRRNEARLQPTAHDHVLCGQSFAPSSFLAFGKVLERADHALKAAKALEEPFSCSRYEPIPNFACIQQVLALVLADKDRVEGFPSGYVAADHKFLPFIDAHLHPRA